MSEWNEADQHAQRAERFYRAGQWERALDALRKALEHRPDEGEWWFGLGLTLDALGRYEEAADAYQKALHRRGEDVPGLLHLGIDLIRAGQPESAIEALARVNQLDAGAELGYIHRILAYTLLEEYDQAELMFYLARQFAAPDEEPAADSRAEHADGSEPAGSSTSAGPGARERQQTQAMAYDYLAQSLVVRHDYDRAVWCWHEALGLDPAHPEANRSLAMLHHQRGQHERARLYYQRQLRLTPEDVETLMDFAHLLMQQNRLAQAGDKYRRALECDGTLAAAHERLGQIALINSHLNAAADRFERARQLDPDLPGVHLGLALTAHERGDLEQAQQWILDELDLEGQTADQVLAIAQLLVDLDLNREAVRLLNPLLSGADDLLMSDDDSYAVALLCRGMALIAQDDIAAGTADLQRCLNLVPDTPQAIVELAGCYLQSGQLNEGLELVQEGLALRPGDPLLIKLKQKLRRARLIRRARRWWGRRPPVAADTASE